MEPKLKSSRTRKRNPKWDTKETPEEDPKETLKRPSLTKL